MLHFKFCNITNAFEFWQRLETLVNRVEKFAWLLLSLPTDKREKKKKNCRKKRETFSLLNSHCSRSSSLNSIVGPLLNLRLKNITVLGCETYQLQLFWLQKSGSKTYHKPPKTVMKQNKETHTHRNSRIWNLFRCFNSS